MRKNIAIISLFLLAASSLLATGCVEDMTAAQKGAVAGAAAGGAAGGLLGGSRKATVIGAGAGALGGALLNDELQK